MHYLLFSAGEDSGDVLGAELVSAVKGCGLNAVGGGGPLMQKAGLKTVCDYEKLPVSGFGDVLPKYFKLRKEFAKLKDALESNMCVGLVAIDYPGFNMRLAKLAEKLGKPVLYVAPPQIWAWKKKRAQALRQMENMKLAVFFDFEEQAYKNAGCDVERIKHPVCCGIDALRDASTAPAAFDATAGLKPQELLLLPGSRRSAAVRNLLAFVAVGTQYRLKYLSAHENSQLNLSVVASRSSLEVPLMLELENIFGGQVPNWVRLVSAPQTIGERIRFYSKHSAALCAFGSCTLEMAVAKVPFVASFVPDILTLLLGRFFVKTNSLALPNIVLHDSSVPEFVIRKRSDMWKVDKIASTLLKQTPSAAAEIGERLGEKLNVGKTLKELMLEFLGQFLEGKSH